MRRPFFTNLIFLSLFLILSVSGYGQQPWRSGEMQVKVFAETPEQFGYISGLGLNADIADGFLRCYLTPDELTLVKTFGIKTETEIGDLNAWSASFGTDGVPGGYYTVAQLNEIADSLAANFPEICTLHSLGIGSGLDVIYALKISDNSAEDEDEPELLFDGGIHGDEVGGSENMIRFARDLCLQYNVDPYITELVNTREIWIIYCLNPYGRKYMTRYNNAGVDVNRDCGFMWNGEGNSPAVFSQPESKALRKALTDNQIVIHCSYHSGTEFISFPWSYRAAPTPDHAQHNFLAGLYASTSGYPNIPYGQGYSGMYAINGSTKDFGYGATGAISWSVELSMSKQPPAAQIVPIYLKNKPAMLTMVEYAGYGIKGIVTDAVTGDPVVATVFVNNFYPVVTNASRGDFHKFLIPGKYSVKVVANGYKTQVIEDVTVNSKELTELEIPLQPEPSQYAVRLISCRIPNNNYNDPGITHAALGPPDSIQYSIGRFGWAVFDMGTPVADGEGIDVIVHENDPGPEGYQFYAGPTMDGPWSLLGMGTGNTGFDLAVTPLTEARYFKITDDGDGQSQIIKAGFDLDAIEGIVRIPPLDSTGWISGVAYKDSLGPVAGALVYAGEWSAYTDENGAFVIKADTGFVKICAEISSSLYMFGCDTVFVAPGDTTFHNIELRILEKVNLIRQEALFTIIPNPAGDQAEIRFGTSVTDAGITLTDLSGRVLIQRKTGTAMNCFLNLSSLPPGMYLLNVHFSNGVIQSRKLMVIR